MFGHRRHNERVDTYLSESGRIIALVSAANDRFQATATSEGAVSGALVQYYRSRIAFLEHVHVYFDYLDDLALPQSCREDFEAYTAFLDTQTLFSRLRYLWLSKNEVSLRMNIAWVSGSNVWSRLGPPTSAQT